MTLSKAFCLRPYCSIDRFSCACHKRMSNDFFFLPPDTCLLKERTLQMLSSAPLVGMHFRPPAKAILQGLPSGCPLLLEREPSNAYDTSAIKVLVAQDTLSALPQDNKDFIGTTASGYGFDLDTILDGQTDWQLGYIAGKSSQNEAAEIAPWLDQGYVVDCSLDFAPNGSPIVRLKWRL